MADTSLSPKIRKYCCIPETVDRSCKIFAVISAVKWGVFTSIVFVMACMDPSTFFVILLICVALPFGFTLILCKGVFKRRPNLLKIYMVFAAVLMIIFASCIFLYILLAEDIGGDIFFFLILFAFYCRSLVVVKGAHELFLAEEAQNVAQMLAQNTTKDYCSLEAVEAPAPEEP